LRHLKYLGVIPGLIRDPGVMDKVDSIGEVLKDGFMNFKFIFRITLVLSFCFIGCFPGLSEESNPQINGLKLPPGFSISIFCDNVPGVRSMTLSPEGVVIAGTREESVYAIIDEDRDGKADQVRTILEGMNMPNGVAFHEGDLYVAEVNQIWKLSRGKRADFKDAKKTLIRGDLPTDRHHGWKYIGFGPDGMLYVPVGAPCNVCLRDDERYSSLLRMKPDGSGLEVYASGIRNTVGFDWDPFNGNLWFTDNGRDWMGDDLPSDELNVSTSKGSHYGFPYCHQGDVQDPEFSSRPCSEFIPPSRKLGAHVASLGIRFYKGTQFPKRYKDGAFIAEHGSWNRSSKVGYRVVFATIHGKKSPEEEVFIEGWLKGEKVSGRPVDLLELNDGSLLISDDFGGRIYRVSYEKKTGDSTGNR